jgi:hypothetical protein
MRTNTKKPSIFCCFLFTLQEMHVVSLDASHAAYRGLFRGRAPTSGRDIATEVSIQLIINTVVTGMQDNNVPALAGD